MSRFCLISCDVFFREMSEAVLRSPQEVETHFLPKGLHETGCIHMRERIQKMVDEMDGPAYDALLLGYGFCNGGLAGIEARTLPIVLPRAHDCITLFLGAKERYLDYFNANPGVYFKTTGWMERTENGRELSQLSISRNAGLEASFEELVEKYGEDNARYLYEELCQQKHYGKIAFIEMGVEPDDSFEMTARSDAAGRGWGFEKLQGDLSMIQRLVDGDWNESEFLVIQPGQRIAPQFNEKIIKAE